VSYPFKMRDGSWIPARLQQLQEEGKNKNQAALATFLGIHSSRVYEMSGGRRSVQLEEVIPIAQYLEMDPMQVLMLATGLNSAQTSVPSKGEGVDRDLMSDVFCALEDFLSAEPVAVTTPNKVKLAFALYDLAKSLPPDERPVNPNAIKKLKPLFLSLMA
jgi:hypothetical protein